MRGKEVFYPIGWDDNGLATERRVQNYYGISCDPSLPYEPDLELPGQDPSASSRSAAGRSARVPVSRRNFIELCRELTERDERAYEDAWRRLGLSVDWSTSYRTIEDAPAAVSQRAFLQALAAGDAYQAQAPVLWDVTFGTAVAQAEIEDREQAGSYWRLAFSSECVPPGWLCGGFRGVVPPGWLCGGFRGVVPPGWLCGGFRGVVPPGWLCGGFRGVVPRG